MAGAVSETLDRPSPAIWLSDPEGDAGVNGIEQGDPVAGASGSARVDANGATSQVKATGLVPGHTYTVWVVHFSDQTLSVDGCNGADLQVAGAGVLWGDGKIAAGNGQATFNARLSTGYGAEHIGQPPPPPFSFAAYEPGPGSEFHVVIRSHGPKIPGEIHSHLTQFGGGCVRSTSARCPSKLATPPYQMRRVSAATSSCTCSPDSSLTAGGRRASPLGALRPVQVGGLQCAAPVGGRERRNPDYLRAETRPAARYRIKIRSASWGPTSHGGTVCVESPERLRPPCSY